MADETTSTSTSTTTSAPLPKPSQLRAVLPNLNGSLCDQMANIASFIGLFSDFYAKVFAGGQFFADDICFITCPTTTTTSTSSTSTTTTAYTGSSTTTSTSTSTTSTSTTSTSTSTTTSAPLCEGTYLTCTSGQAPHEIACSTVCSQLDNLVGFPEFVLQLPDNALACVGAPTSGTFSFHGNTYSVDFEYHQDPVDDCPAVDYYDIRWVSTP